MSTEVNVQDRIVKPLHEVFSAIVDPNKMSKYFISSSTGPLATNAKLRWEFADVGASIDVDVIEVTENTKFVFDWNASGHTKARVTIQLIQDQPEATLVKINERKLEPEDATVQWAIGQTAGWTHFLCCLKAYTQYGINLRQGHADSS